ncbi:hypothetical protein [Mesobacillus subterraneus]|uniref:hypothetical protein n=1 Tax=Mesobacillus subterraneus TaxID=285983 RepID=UPI001474FF3A|nr:hypothetical protein [Mesobacillus subterraneus]
MLSGILMLAGLCVFEIILAKIALGSSEILDFNFQEFYEWHDANGTKVRDQDRSL